MKYRKNEKGAALLLALGFAALLLVLIMGFVTNALIERKVASTNADRTEAKSIAMNALNRAIVAMQYQMIMQYQRSYDEGVYRFDNIVSKNNENVYNNSVGQINVFITTIPQVISSAEDAVKFSGLEDIFVQNPANLTERVLKNGSSFYIYKYPLNASYDYNENGNTNLPALNIHQPQWQYVRQNGFAPNASGNPWSTANPRSPVIGRYLYAVLPDMGSIPVSAFSAPAPTNPWQGMRTFGNNLSSIENIYTNYSDSDIFHVGQEFSSSITASQAFDLQNRLETLISHRRPSPNNGFYDNNLNEAYRQGPDFFFGNNTHSDSNLRSPRQMIRLNNLGSYTSVNSLMDAIPYLRKIDSDATVRNQIAANIIEAFNPSNTPDSSNRIFATSDSTDWTNTAPTYTGNRRSPYINEIEVSLQNFIADIEIEDKDTNSDGSDDTRTYTVKPKITVQVGIELYSPYMNYTVNNNDFVDDRANVRVRFYKIDNGGAPEAIGTEKTVTLTKLTSVPANYTSSTTYPVVFYSGTVTCDAIIKDIIPLEGNPNLEVYAAISAIDGHWIYKTVNSGISTYLDYVSNLNSIFGDFSNVNLRSNTIIVPVSTANTSITENKVDVTTNKAKNISMQVLDARVNLNAGNWYNSFSTNALEAGSGTVESNLGKENTFRNSTSGTPPTNAVVISNIFPDMTSLNNISLADFGVISRGRPGDTLNIHAVGATDTNSINNTVNDIRYTTNSSGVCSCGNTNCSTHRGSSSSGDGGLLDQITTIVDSTPQLIDINTRSVAVWKSLLSNIRGDVTAANPTPNYILDATNAENLARKISWRIRNDNAFFKSRSGFIAVFNASLGSVNSIPATVSSTNAALTDREKQIILGKILPLCKTEDYPEFIQVIVVAQKIKDIGGYDNDNPSNNFIVGDNFGSFEYGRDQIVSEVRLLAKIRRRVDTSVTPHRISFEIVSIEELID